MQHYKQHFLTPKIFIMRKVLTLVAIMLCVISCRKDEEGLLKKEEEKVQPNEKPEQETNMEAWKWLSVTDNTSVSMEEARKIALETAYQLQDQESVQGTSFFTRNIPIKIESVSLLSKEKTQPTFRKAPKDVDFYLVHFSNNKGYALVSGDKRVPGVMAYCPYGRLDSITNPGQAVMLSAIEDYVENQKAIYESKKDSLRKIALNHILKKLSWEKKEQFLGNTNFVASTSKMMSGRGDCVLIEDEPRYSDPSGWTVSDKILPLIKTLWSQKGMYNDLVWKQCSNNEQAPAGCVAIAVGQIMAYHKKPRVFMGREMHWEDMTKIDPGDMFSQIDNNSVGNNPTAVADIQYLLARLGEKHLLQMDYGCGNDGSGSTVTRAFHTFNVLGFHPSLKYSMEVNSMLHDLKNHRPVYIRGCSSRKSFLNIEAYTIYENCHAWVIDGYIRKYYNIFHHYFSNCMSEDEFHEVVSETHVEEYIHCNFGWGGDKYGGNGYSGWYRIGIFDASLGHPGQVHPSNTFQRDAGREGNYKYDFRLITNIN